MPQRPHSRTRCRRPGPYRPRFGCLAICWRTNAAIPTREARSAEDGAVKQREEARPVAVGGTAPPPFPGEATEAGPEAADLTAGPDGREYA
jgi:hypothetical protein